MDEQYFRNMIAKIPRSRVPINKSIWMNRYGIKVYLSYILVGSTAFFFLGSLKIFNPYTFNPKQKIYKAHPDYVNGTIAFYEKEVDNVVRNL